MANRQTQLAHLILADAATVQATATELSAEAGWSDLLQLSYKWRVTPQVWQRLQALEITLDPTVKQEFAQLCRMVAVQSSTASYRSAHVLHRLNQAGVNAIAFKGIGLIAGLYGKPGDRMVGDV
ncbi:MAG TPA: nucleotidyltransferase family protein, partial [Chroococcidiopsis sp.]